MASKSSIFIGGLAIVAAMVSALPAAQGIAAISQDIPTVQVNRGAKGDRLAVSRSIAVKQAPTETETARDTPKTPTEKPRIMDGCDPMFSPVAVPAMAHVAGRCVG